MVTGTTTFGARRYFAARMNAAAAPKSLPLFRRFSVPFKFLMAAAFGMGTTGVAFVACAAAAPAAVDYKAVKADIVALIGKSDNKLGPVLIRLAWHEAGTWDKDKKDGFPNDASMQFAPECKHAANAGLDGARKALEPIFKKHPGLTRADLWTLAACIAVEEMGGPTIKWRSGRTDASGPEQCPPDGRLPDAHQGQQHIRDVFVKRMGFTEEETVALIGAHTVGECHRDRSGYVGPWTFDPLGFDNAFFTILLENDWIVDTRYEKLQFTDSATRKLMMLPADVALILDPKMKRICQQFTNQDIWHAAFARAFQKLLELGVSAQLKDVKF